MITLRRPETEPHSHVERGNEEGKLGMLSQFQVVETRMLVFCNKCETAVTRESR